MKTMCGFGVAVALLSAAMGPALIGQTEKSIVVEQQDPGQLEKHRAEIAVLLPPGEEPGEAQEAQQKVEMELIAADGQVVKGKPYSADASTETVQTLADGNRIVHRTVSKFYRDSDGRTRREQTFGNVDPQHPSPHEVKIFVDDPAGSAAYVLDPESKSGDKVMRTRKFIDERITEDEGTRVMVKSTSDSDAEEPGSQRHMIIKFRDEHSGNPTALVTQAPDEKRDVVKEDLGTKTVEGVDCNGTRQTITIPAGAIGNEKPVRIVTETWFSPAIAAIVESTTDDPRYGKTTYYISNVQLSEPPRALFEVPADFKVNGRK